MTKRNAIGTVSLIVVVAVIALVFWFSTRPADLTIQGEVSANRTDVSARTSGRVAALKVDVGDTVQVGDVLAELSSPQLQAALEAAQAGLEVAKADLARVSSTRPEVIKARQAEVAAAEADVALAQSNFDRQAPLAAAGNTPQAVLDQATRNVEASIRQREAAEANLELATTGASPQERAVAQAQVNQAAAAVQLRQADIDELNIVAPVSGQITTRVVEQGENVGAGSPVFSIVQLDDVWFTFNLREDLLGGLKIGDQFDVRVPALGDKVVPVKVTLINVQGQYATWRATRATGDFDLRTFEVRAVPVAPVDGLRPGMSGIAAWAPGGAN